MSRREITSEEFSAMVMKWKAECARARKALLEFEEQLDMFYSIDAGYVSDRAFKRAYTRLQSEGIAPLVDNPELDVDALRAAVVHGVAIDPKRSLLDNLFN